ncbi:hypothetical protein EDB84DRAFT_1518531 [Lactarius hengduanensis]|nr:hypothetical protein EDB84DRAFT_1518531 [Lactarius hengduanensis]
MCFHCEMIVRTLVRLAPLAISRAPSLRNQDLLSGLHHLSCLAATIYIPVLLRCSTCERSASSPRFSPCLPSLRTTVPSNPRPKSLIPLSSARHTTTLPRANSSTNSPRSGRPRSCSRATPRGRPCGPASRPAYRRTSSPRDSPTIARAT